MKHLKHTAKIATSSPLRTTPFDGRVVVSLRDALEQLFPQHLSFDSYRFQGSVSQERNKQFVEAGGFVVFVGRIQQAK